MSAVVTALGVDNLLKLEKELKETYSLYWQPNATDVWHIFGQMPVEILDLPGH